MSIYASPGKSSLLLLTELAQGHIEKSVRCTWWTSRAVARVIRVVLDGGKGAHVGCESVSNDIIRSVHFLLEFQRQQTAQILVVHVQSAVGRDVGWEDGSVGSVQAVALLLGPVRQMGTTVVLVNDTELGDVLHTSEHGHTVRRGGVLSVHQTKLFVGQLLLLGHDVLGQFEQRVLVAPQELAHGHFNERLNLQNVHDTGHGQSQEPVSRGRELQI